MPSAAMVLCHFCFDGWGGRGWTERSEGSPGVSGYRPPTPATPKSNADRALGTIASKNYDAARSLHHSLIHSGGTRDWSLRDGSLNQTLGAITIRSGLHPSQAPHQLKLLFATM